MLSLAFCLTRLKHEIMESPRFILECKVLFTKFRSFEEEKEQRDEPFECLLIVSESQTDTFP